MENAILLDCAKMEILIADLKATPCKAGSPEEAAVKKTVSESDRLCATLAKLGCCPCDDPACQKMIAAMLQPKQFIVIVTVATLIAAGIGALIGHYAATKSVSGGEKTALNQLMKCCETLKKCC